MGDYYDEKLSGRRLKSCYETAPPRVCRYLEAELEHALCKIQHGHHVLELGCGYGRLLPPIAAKAGRVIGIDSSLDNLVYGREVLAGCDSCDLQVMDAANLGFRDDRLEWFRLQAAAGLLGEIDEEHTGNGVIVCHDGFRATTVNADGFSSLLAGLNVRVHIVEIDELSLFCEIVKS